MKEKDQCKHAQNALRGLIATEVQTPPRGSRSQNDTYLRADIHLLLLHAHKIGIVVLKSAVRQGSTLFPTNLSNVMNWILKQGHPEVQFGDDVHVSDLTNSYGGAMPA